MPPGMPLRLFSKKCQGMLIPLLALAAVTVWLATGAHGSVCDETLVWAKQAGGTSMDSGQAIAVLRDGSSLVTGYFSGTATFGPGETGETSLTSSGGSDIFVAKYNPDGALAWAKRAGGSMSDQGEGISVLPDGGFLITGSFHDAATFGPGEPRETILNASAGSYYPDIFVARYNADGTLAWAKQAGGYFYHQAYGIAALPDGSALVTGYFQSGATFGPGETGETTLSGAGGNDLFVAKYNPDGTLAWARKAGGSFSDYGQDVAVLADSSSFVTGYFADTATFGPGETGETLLTAAGESDVFIAKYNADGTLAWAKQAGGDSYDEAYGIAALADGSTLVTGRFFGMATFGPGEPGETSLSSGTSQDIFVARYNPNGTLAWATKAGGSSSDAGEGIAVRADGSALVTGHFYGTATFGPGEPGETSLTAAASAYPDIFVARYNADGSLAWAKKAGGPDAAWGDYGRDVAALADGSALATGQFENTATFGPGEPGETVLTGYVDIFVARYGAPRWDDEMLLRLLRAWHKYADGDLDGDGLTDYRDAFLLGCGWHPLPPPVATPTPTRTPTATPTRTATPIPTNTPEGACANLSGLWNFSFHTDYTDWTWNMTIANVRINQDGCSISAREDDRHGGFGDFNAIVSGTVDGNSVDMDWDTWEDILNPDHFYYNPCAGTVNSSRTQMSGTHTLYDEAADPPYQYADGTWEAVRVGS